MAKKKYRIFGITSRFLMLIVAALLALSYLSIVINPAKLWPVSLSGIFYVPLMTVNLLLLLWAFKRRSKSFVIPLLALIPSFFFIGRYVQLPSESADDQPVSGEVVKIISWNVGRFALHDSNTGINTSAQCVDSIFSFIRQQDPDIICLQEFHRQCREGQIISEASLQGLYCRVLPFSGCSQFIRQSHAQPSSCGRKR